LSTKCRLAAALSAIALISSFAGTAAAAPSAGGSAFGDANLSAKRLGDRVPLQRGMRGRDVKSLQSYLYRVGLRVSRDSDFGTATYRALRRFEKRAARPVDGQVDREDIAALLKVVAGGGFKIKKAQAAPLVPVDGPKAVVNADGTATPPIGAPPEVVAIIEAGNEIATKPYRYGGGHGSYKDSGYDCSGSISYALHGGGLLETPRDSTGFESFGSSGPGEWVTIYANSGHAYMVVAGLRFDTSGRSKAGTRWQADTRSSSGYVVRHPDGL
jgi:hypothetical protein